MIFRIFGGAEFQVPASSFRGKHDFLFPPPKLGEIGGDPWMLMDKVLEIILLYHFALCPQAGISSPFLEQ